VDELFESLFRVAPASSTLLPAFARSIEERLTAEVAQGQEGVGHDAVAARLHGMAAKMTAAVARGAVAKAQQRLADAQQAQARHAGTAQQQVVQVRAAAARLQAEEEARARAEAAMTAQQKAARARTFQAAATPPAALRYRRSPSPASDLAAAADAATPADTTPDAIMAGVLAPHQLVHALRALPSKALAPPLPLDLQPHEHEPLRGGEPEGDGRRGPSRGSRAARRLHDAVHAGHGDEGKDRGKRAALPPVRPPSKHAAAPGGAKKRKKLKIAAAAAAATGDDADLTYAAVAALPAVRRPMPHYSMRSSTDGAATSVDALRLQRQKQLERQLQLQKDIFALVNDRPPGGPDAVDASAAARPTSSGSYGLSSHGGSDLDRDFEHDRSRAGSADRPTRWRGLEEGAGGALALADLGADARPRLRGVSPLSVPGAATLSARLPSPHGHGHGSAPSTRPGTSTGALSLRSHSPVPFGYDPDATVGYQEAWLRKLNALVASNRFSSVTVFKKAVKVISSRLNIPRLHEPVASAAQAEELVGRMTGHGLRSPGASPGGGGGGGCGGGDTSPSRRSHRQDYSDATYHKPFTIAEYFCALADADGDLDRAVDRLRKREFAAEVRHVCGPVSGVDVYGTLRKVGGGIEALLRQEQQTIEDLLCAKFSSYIDKDEGAAVLLDPLTARSYLSIAATGE